MATISNYRQLSRTLKKKIFVLKNSISDDEPVPSFIGLNKHAEECGVSGCLLLERSDVVKVNDEIATFLTDWMMDAFHLI